MRYDPNVPPLPGEWLDLDEDERMQLLTPLCKVPPHAADQVRREFRFQGSAIVLVEAQPSFKNPREWMEHSVAKFRFFKRTGVWRLYCQFRDLKWHAYERQPNSKDLATLVAGVHADPTGIFGG